MVVAQKTEESDMADNMLLLTRNLLRIAIYHITYIRGLFHEKYFSEKSVLSPEMKNEKLIPVDHDLGRLIDWMEKGVCDALQKKYLKTLLFCICEKEEGPMIEEYAFSFSYPNTNSEEIVMIVSRTGSKNGSTTFKSNASELTPDQMKRYGCKMIRTLVSLMKIVDSKPKMVERTVLVKLLYYDDVTTEDYEPPCAENEAINIWNKNPLKMEVGNVNSKHLVLALKVKGVLDPCDDNNAKRGWDEMKVDSDFDIDGDFSDTQAQSIGWGQGVDHAGESAAQGNGHGWQWLKDPRLDYLGYRGIFPADTIPPLVESDKEADERHYQLWRIENGVAEGLTEIPKGEAIPLEYNLAGLNAISFEKGCYIGQELIARTHHRGVIRKRLMPMKFVDENGQELEQAVAPGSEVVDEASGKKVGTVNTALGSRGMGLLRLEEALRPGSALRISDNRDVRVQAIKPDWWPAEWTQVLQQQSAAA